MIQVFGIKFRRDPVVHQDPVAPQGRVVLKVRIVVYRVQKQQIECRNRSQHGMIDSLQNNFLIKPCKF